VREYNIGVGEAGANPRIMGRGGRVPKQESREAVGGTAWEAHQQYDMEQPHC
jgi:hypothetical protein